MLEFNFSPFPVLETERLVLREFDDTDLPNFFKMRSDAAVMKYVDRPKPLSIEDVKVTAELIKTGVSENTSIGWTITYKNDPALIGQIGFWRNDREHHRGEIGYMLMAPEFGKGIASEATAAVVKYGFEKMNLHSMTGNVDPNNAASIRVLEKAGFVKEAHFREDYYFNGKFGDSAIYCLLQSDWLARR